VYSAKATAWWTFISYYYTAFACNDQATDGTIGSDYMSESKHNLTPYRSLGFRLKRLREKLHESLAEVSGAVEIEPENLALIEQGEHRPSEDVLLLLISHLDPQEDEAVKLWELAGYDQSNLPTAAEEPTSKPIVMLLQPDSRIMYSDAVNIVTNQQGVVMNFLQTQGNGPANPIARVGMSQAQAMQVFEALGQSLKRAQQPPRFLSAPDESNQNKV
jgi:transcriptional regulator with XRE-family HTH domain